MQVPVVIALAAGLASFVSEAAVTSTHQCYVEPGFDYIDNDIGSVASPTADECCAKCEVATGCKAYSWTDMNGGMCWLKSGRGTIVVNSTVQTATMQPLGSSNNVGGCQLDEGIDYVGNDIGSVHMLKPLSCCSACLGKGPTVVNPAARSAQPYMETPTCGLEYGIDYVGNDIGSAPAGQSGDCCELCSKTEGCRAFSWNQQSGGTCLLKNRKDNVVRKAGVTSAQWMANPASPSCALELDVDYVGNDIGSASSADPYACCSKCMAKRGCGAFSWSDHLGGTCWFKSGKGATLAKSGVKSAVV
ncbi:unnamed protein product [Phytophthora fragariaefolia]|uniref:Unnamed protein product n=1 Tax=Phytophthora fragariaefolia TaxID=1490495 RepID=A0A9W7D1N8_9STRA|nr:unnamed protein product [Phytophthora fragariaefolia]